jgi:hypothetical protein
MLLEFSRSTWYPDERGIQCSKIQEFRKQRLGEQLYVYFERHGTFE